MFNKKTLIASIQLALGMGLALPALAGTTLSGVNTSGGSFTFSGATLTNSTVTFNAPAGGQYGNLVSNGDFSATNSTIKMNTVFNAGGTTVSGQDTNRILINGNMSGVAILSIANNGGAGASTDLNGNNVNDANEGISVAQVSGTSSAGAFSLQGDYVAVGAYQYRLYAYQPGKSDPTQRLVNADSDGHWDYRLQNAKASTTPVAPVGPVGPVNPNTPVVHGLVPQASSYLVHNNALLAYGQEVIGSLHQRVGEIGGAHEAQDGGFEMYARAFGNDRRYITDLRFDEYGHDYEQTMHGLQLGGNWLMNLGEDSSVRLGLFYANGQSKVTPSDVYDHLTNQAIGTSRSKVKAANYAATVTWQSNGFYVDGVFGASDYRSDIYTGRGLAARLDSNDIFASVEAGYGWQVNDYLTVQPQAQVAWHKLDTETAYDIDGLRVDMGQPEVFVWRVGARALLTPDTNAHGTALTQYVKLNVYGSEGPHQRLHLANTYVGTGEFGQTAEFGYGMTAAFNQRLSVYGEMAWQKDIGGPSREGWTANLGLRWSF